MKLIGMIRNETGSRKKLLILDFLFSYFLEFLNSPDTDTDDVIF
jgi:hypothetical protein